VLSPPMSLCQPPELNDFSTLSLARPRNPSHPPLPGPGRTPDWPARRAKRPPRNPRNGWSGVWSLPGPKRPLHGACRARQGHSVSHAACREHAANAGHGRPGRGGARNGPERPRFGRPGSSPLSPAQRCNGGRRKADSGPVFGRSAMRRQGFVAWAGFGRLDAGGIAPGASRAVKRAACRRMHRRVVAPAKRARGGQPMGSHALTRHPGLPGRRAVASFGKPGSNPHKTLSARRAQCGPR
jgi:hypothetical protein